MNIICLAIIKAASFKICLILNPQKEIFDWNTSADFLQKTSFLIFASKIWHKRPCQGIMYFGV